MLSHDFAQALLKRRNHDMRFAAEVCFPGRDDEDGDLCRTQMMDDRNRTVGHPEPVEILSYSSEDDVLEVALGPIFAGEEGGYYFPPEEALMVLKALRSEIHHINHMAANPEARERFTQLYDRLRAAIR